MANKKLLWLDDVRDPMTNDWLNFSPIGRSNIKTIWVKSYHEFIKWISDNGLPDGINFDHDLGKEIEINLLKKGFSKKETRKLKKDEYTGYDAAKWLVDYCLDNNLELPPYKVHSANPVGKENIEKLLKNYGNRTI